MMTKKEYRVLYLLSLITALFCLVFIFQNLYLTVKINDISTTLDKWGLDEN